MWRSEGSIGVGMLWAGEEGRGEGEGQGGRGRGGRERKGGGQRQERERDREGEERERGEGARRREKSAGSVGYSCHSERSSHLTGHLHTSNHRCLRHAKTKQTQK